jgi:superfamily II DNA or RNA helicase
MITSSYFAKYNSIVMRHLFDQKTELYPHQEQSLLKLHDLAVKGELNPKRSQGRKSAFLLIGVGCGKTVILQSAPYILGQHILGRQVIFLSDNCTLRQRVMDDFPIKQVGKKYVPIQQGWPLYKYGLLSPDTPPPQIVELKPDSKTYRFDYQAADILVTNRQFLINLVKNGVINPDAVGLIVVDEAHHSAAKTYLDIFNYFDNASLVFLTGSRNRGDGEPLPFIQYENVESEEDNGQIVLKRAPKPDFEFTIQDAWKQKSPIIKKIAFSPARSEAFRVEEDGKEYEYTVEEFFLKAETDRQWFRQCILANSFCEPVLNRAVEILELKRQGNRPHKMIIRALNIHHADRLYQLCQNYSLLQGRVGLVHSKLEEYDSEGRPHEVIEKFYKDEYIALIHVSMIGEGFNEPYASVSVPLCVMRSIQKAEQEFGRIIRKVDGTDPSNDVDFQSDNLAVVVTHAALGIDKLFNKFLAGEEAILVEEESEEEEIKRHRVLTDNYSAGDELLHLSSTDGLHTGDQVMVKTYDNLGKEQKYYFQIEDVVGDGTLQVTPISVEIPKDSPARKSYNNDDDAIQFKGHIGLEWYLLIDGEYISINDYRRKEVIKKRNFDLDKDGEIINSSGIKIKNFGPELHQGIVDLIEHELKTIEIPYNQLVSCRPDQEKKDRQQSYRKQVNRAIYNLLSDQLFVPDGKDGTSLIELELECLKGCSQKTAEKNSDFLMSQIFGYVKRQTGKEWRDHQTDDEYEAAKKLAFEKLQEVRSEIKKRHGYKDLLDLIE